MQHHLSSAHSGLYEDCSSDLKYCYHASGNDIQYPQRQLTAKFSPLHSTTVGDTLVISRCVIANLLV